MKKKLNILIADDHPWILDGLKKYLKKIRKVNQVFLASDGEEVINFIKKQEYHVDILFLDLRMKKKHGIETIVELYKMRCDVKIIVLTQFDDIQHLKPLYNLRIKVMLDKVNAIQDIPHAINAVLKHEEYFSERIREHIKNIIKGKRKSEPRDILTPSLPPRRKEVLMYLICTNLTQKEIAEKMNISFKTVDTHCRTIYEKDFNIHKRSELVLKALLYGIVDYTDFFYFKSN